MSMNLAFSDKLRHTLGDCTMTDSNNNKMKASCCNRVYKFTDEKLADWSVPDFETEYAYVNADATQGQGSRIYTAEERKKWGG